MAKICANLASLPCYWGDEGGALGLVVWDTALMFLCVAGRGIGGRFGALLGALPVFVTYSPVVGLFVIASLWGPEGEGSLWNLVWRLRGMWYVATSLLCAALAVLVPRRRPEAPETPEQTSVEQ